MTAHIRPLTFFAIALIAALGSHHAAAQQAMEVSQSELIRGLLPTVVSITSTVAATTQKAADPAANADASRAKPLFGSGFVIDPSGLIATNEHVLTGAYQIKVTFSDGQTASAKLVAAAPMIDIAVIRVDTQHPLEAVRWGDSDTLQIGDPVIAIGNPLGVGMSVSTGVVSALNRHIEKSEFDNYIQTDAAINRGNSGGPLFNRAGELIGMNTALISPTRGSAGLGFAQPSNDVRFVTDRLIHHDWVRPGWAGLVVEDVTPELAHALGMQSPKGSIVAALSDGGPAAAAGLEVGDVVLRFGDRTPRDSRELMRLIAMTTVDQTVPVAVLRDGRERIIPVAVKLWPASAQEIAARSTQAAAPTLTIPADLGLSLGAVSPAMREKYGLDVTQVGVVITGIAAGTDAATRGLAVGDVILRVQKEQVRTPQQVQAQIDAARTHHQLYVAALVLKKAQDTPDPAWIPLRVSPP
jgi:serine protease Do